MSAQAIAEYNALVPASVGCKHPDKNHEHPFSAILKRRMAAMGSLFATHPLQAHSPAGRSWCVTSTTSFQLMPPEPT